jgi:carbon storage regulator
MLVLSRKVNERIVIDDNIIVTIVKLGKECVRVGIEAPDQVKIFRQEIYPTRMPDEGSGRSDEPSC